MPQIILLVLVIAAIVAAVKCIRIVPQSHAYIVERLGAYKETWSVGIHFLTPFIERVAQKINMKENYLDFEPQMVITKDNVRMEVDSVVYYKVTDPQKFRYAVERPLGALDNLTATTLRAILGGMELDETLTSREEINNKMQSQLDLATDPWGIKVIRVELKNITPPKGIQEAMEKQMKAERDRRENLLEAEGHKQSVMTRAEGDKQAKILQAEAEKAAVIARAEAQARAIELVNMAQANAITRLREAHADEAVIKLKSLEALEKVANGRATKLIVPTELTSVASTLAAITEMADGGKSMPVDTSPAPVVVEKEDDPCCDDDSNEKQENGKATSEGTMKQAIRNAIAIQR